MINELINRYKNFRKRNYLNLAYKHKYAFIGIGHHSMNNLYPVLDYLRVPLKYIVVSSEKNAEIIDEKFEGVIGTNDLEKVLNDPEIQGVLICASPQSHFALIKKSLEHNKHVFVEKPPCGSEAELHELIEVEKNSKGTCLIGLQKCYAPIINTLKKNLKTGIISYNYRFVTGAYPEGDNVLDIFIHPLNLITYLFGGSEVLSVQQSPNGTSFIHLKHDKCLGSIELSTEYSWKNAEEMLIINTEAGVYSMKNMEYLDFQKKSKLLFSIPLEKVIKSKDYLHVLYNRNNFSPVPESNQLYTSGYYHEIKTFIDICENGKGSNTTQLTDMISTYKLIKHLKK